MEMCTLISRQVYTLQAVSHFGESQRNTRERKSPPARRRAYNFRHSPRVASPRLSFARARVYFGHTYPIIAIAEIRDYSQSEKSAWKNNRLSGAFHQELLDYSVSILLNLCLKNNGLGHGLKAVHEMNSFIELCEEQKYP